MSDSESTLTDVQPDTEQEGTMASSTSTRKMTAQEVYEAVKKIVAKDDGSPTGVSVKAATAQVAKQTGRSEATVRETYYRRGRKDDNNVIKARVKSRTTGTRRPSYTKYTKDGGANNGEASKATPKATRSSTGTRLPTRDEINAAIQRSMEADERAMEARTEVMDMLKQTGRAVEAFDAIREQFSTV